MHVTHGNILPLIYHSDGGTTLHTPQPITQNTTHITHTFKRYNKNSFTVILFCE